MQVDTLVLHICIGEGEAWRGERDRRGVKGEERDRGRGVGAVDWVREREGRHSHSQVRVGVGMRD